MREIKFRAWHKLDKKMYEVTYFNLDKGYIGLARDDVATNVWSINDIELMQYTGLHDRLGKEVYEGDIVRDDTFDIVGTVTWIEGALGIYVLSKTASYALHNEQEVIGNIYEKPLKELVN